jgi:stage II sporulation protein D
MRRLFSLLVLAVGLALPGQALGEPTFVFRGHGWGHGIGMAQWGAYGFAQNGWTYADILAHYYQGTELGPAPAATIRVLLAGGRESIEVTSAAAFRVTDASGFSATLPAGPLTLDTSLAITVDGKARTLVPPIRFLPGKAQLQFGKPYRGSLVVRLASGQLQVVNRVALERYLWGVVPGEMPAAWHEEALKVQAVAARSYALVSRRTGNSFDVYADTRDQVYGGVLVEDPRSTAAVNATKWQVVLYEGKVAWTFFSSSSGGRTAAIEEVWPDSEPLPYLVSVDDPYDTISPHHDWGPISFTATELKARLGNRAPAEITGLQVNPSPSGRAASVTLQGPNGQTEVSGWDMRIALGLRSTWFTVDGSAALRASASRVVYGDRVRLTAVARDVGEVVLERRPAGGSWTLARRLTPGKRGNVSVTVRPKVTTTYRLRLDGSPGPTVRVSVAPKLTLLPGEVVGVFVGSIEPMREGIVVTIQFRDGGDWQAVSTAEPAGGLFRAELDLAPGEYRAWVPAAGGLVAGTSPSVVVS